MNVPGSMGKLVFSFADFRYEWVNMSQAIRKVPR
jgi:hypothetical protein